MPSPDFARFRRTTRPVAYLRGMSKSHLLTTGQAAQRAGVTQRTIQQWIARGLLPRLTALPNSNRHFIKSEDLDRVLNPQEHQ